ncbi:hypothetical protein I7I48_09424 [Histoplasma ohiense]|nr:hypothetical protein I7I48_09424 [Histoplasma ohiense (nom. inval.)]
MISRRGAEDLSLFPFVFFSCHICGIHTACGSENIFKGLVRLFCFLSQAYPHHVEGKGCRMSEQEQYPNIQLFLQFSLRSRTLHTAKDNQHALHVLCACWLELDFGFKHHAFMSREDVIFASSDAFLLLESYKGDILSWHVLSLLALRKQTTF